MVKRKNKLKKEPPRKPQQEFIREFYRKVLTLQEEEKRRISRDLHDETGQIVIALGASLNIVEKELKEGRVEDALKLISENRKLITEIANKMKLMASNLRPPSLDILGLPAVLRDYFSQCTKSSPIKIEFNESIKDVRVNENIEITLYRIVQEALYNILKHSMAKNVKVNLIFINKKIELTIKDDGKGFDAEDYERRLAHNKMGLRGIKERVDILNGAFSVSSVLEEGTTLKVTLPLEI